MSAGLDEAAWVIKWLSTIVAAFSLVLGACGSDAAPTPAPLPPTTVVEPPPPPPLDPAVRAALEAALRGAPLATTIGYAETHEGMEGSVSRSFELTRSEDAFVGRLTCSIMGARREVDVRIETSLATRELTRLAALTPSSDPGAGLGGILEGSESRALTLRWEGHELTLDTTSFEGASDPWRLGADGASGFVPAPVVEQVIASLVAAVNAERCDRTPASAFVPASGIPGHL